MPHGSDHRKPLMRVLVATAAIVGLAWGWSRLGSVDSQPMSAGESTDLRHESPAPPQVATPVLSPEEQLRAQFCGCWFHVENGQQWIENRPDGTARMLLKLDFLSSLYYGQVMHLDLTWAVEDGILTHTIVSGTPTANVNSLVKDFGKTVQYLILETTPERMLLQSKSDKEKDLWTRSPFPPEWAK